jgi:hypothetical protein
MKKKAVQLEVLETLTEAYPETDVENCAIKTSTNSCGLPQRRFNRRDQTSGKAISGKPYGALCRRKLTTSPRLLAF